MAENFFDKAKVSFSRDGIRAGGDIVASEKDMTVVRQLDREKARGVVHNERMKVLKIKPQEVLDEPDPDFNLASTPEPGELSPFSGTVKQYPPEPEIIIYCSPYHVESANGQYTLKSSNFSSDPLIYTVTIFGAIWVITTLLMFGITKFAGYWYFFKVIPFILLPLLGLFKGLTHIRLARDGVLFESSSGKSMLRSRTIHWHEIKRIYVEPAKEGKNLLTGKLVFKTSRGSRRIPLKKIASASQWRKLVGGLKQQFPDLKLDLTLMDGLSQGITRDPSYTRLWLDALTAPPMRERLQPLSTGTELQKGAYKVQELIGSGGQGSAYLAQTTDGKVVLKEYILPVYVDVKVRRQALEDFERESKMLRSLSHPGIVKTLGSFVEDHRAYLVLEYVAGKSIKQLVEQRGAFSEKQCASLGVEMCGILDYLHSQSPSVVHQDFAPDNLLVAPDGSIKLIDFMIAKQYDEESANGAAVGKQHYMPPEQFRGKSNTRSDLYAFGCTLYFMLTGEKPEAMSTSHPTLQNRSVSGGMNVIVETATMLDQNARYQSAAQMSRDLNTLLRSLE